MPLEAAGVEPATRTHRRAESNISLSWASFGGTFTRSTRSPGGGESARRARASIASFHPELGAPTGAAGSAQTQDRLAMAKLALRRAAFEGLTPRSNAVALVHGRYVGGLRLPIE